MVKTKIITGKTNLKGGKVNKGAGGGESKVKVIGKNC